MATYGKAYTLSAIAHYAIPTALFALDATGTDREAVPHGFSPL